MKLVTHGYNKQNDDLTPITLERSGKFINFTIDIDKKSQLKGLIEVRAIVDHKYDEMFITNLDGTDIYLVKSSLQSAIDDDADRSRYYTMGYKPESKEFIYLEVSPFRDKLLIGGYAIKEGYLGDVKSKILEVDGMVINVEELRITEMHFMLDDIKNKLKNRAVGD